MPELPEIQALAERVEATAGGATLTGYELMQFSALKTVEPPPEVVIGRALRGVGRRGKYLTFDFEDHRVLVHLSQGGRIDLETPAKKTKPRGRVVRFRFDNQAGVLVKEYGTERKAGWWVLEAGDDGPLVKLGPDADTGAFAELLRIGNDNRRLHTMLRDQRTVAGLGRGYTDDALHLAKLSPFASLKKLDSGERERLIDAVRTSLADGLDVERKRRGGLPPKVGDHWRVHNRYGTPCPDCAADLRRVSYESHEVSYCPACQTDGKILADRRMSRLVK